MVRTARLLAGVLSGHLEIVREHTRARAVQLALLAFCGFTAFVFALVLVTVWLAAAVGIVAALGMMVIVWAVAALIALAQMRAEQRRHAAVMRARRAEDRRIAQSALIAAVPALRRSGLAAAALAGVALFAWLRRGRNRD